MKKRLIRSGQPFTNEKEAYMIRPFTNEKEAYKIRPTLHQ
jgi:hypothetical protein